MKTALIAGSTGLVGQSLLVTLLEARIYHKVITIVRHAQAIQHPKLQEHLIDFNSIDELAIDENVDDVFCCLGTTIKKAGNQAAFAEVDYTYVVELAQWAKRHHCRQYSVISSVGAHARSRNFYLRTKGQMEEAVCSLQLPTVHIIRPSFLIGQRTEARFGEKLFAKIMCALKPLLKGRFKKYRAIQAHKVAFAMYHKAQLGATDIFIYEGTEIR